MDRDEIAYPQENYLDEAFKKCPACGKLNKFHVCGTCPEDLYRVDLEKQKYFL